MPTFLLFGCESTIIGGYDRNRAVDNTLPERLLIGFFLYLGTGGVEIAIRFFENRIRSVSTPGKP